MKVGDIILSRDGSSRGKITAKQARYCAACQRVCACAVVRWEDGKVTKPCMEDIRLAKREMVEVRVWQII